MSLTDTIRTEPTFQFLTEKIKAGKSYSPNLVELLNKTGFPHKIEYYETIQSKNSEEIAIFFFLHEELNLTVEESVLLLQKLESEVTSLIYKKIYQGKRLHGLGFNVDLDNMTAKSLEEIYQQLGE